MWAARVVRDVADRVHRRLASGRRAYNSAEINRIARAAPRPDIQVIVTLETLLGLTQSPATVPGLGRIPADVARGLAADGRPMRPRPHHPLATRHDRPGEPRPPVQAASPAQAHGGWRLHPSEAPGSDSGTPPWRWTTPAGFTHDDQADAPLP